jgi:hypothetical protein
MNLILVIMSLGTERPAFPFMLVILTLSIANRKDLWLFLAKSASPTYFGECASFSLRPWIRSSAFR